MDCPKCKGTDHCKAGFSGDCQRYKCKSCDYHYTVEKVGRQIRRNPPYGSGNVSGGPGFRSIGRLLRISYGIVEKLQ